MISTVSAVWLVSAEVVLCEPALLSTLATVLVVRVILVAHRGLPRHILRLLLVYRLPRLWWVSWRVELVGVRS